MEDFRGPTGDGSRLVLEGDGDSRLLLPGGGNDPLRHSSSASALPPSLKPVSEGRTRIGGTVRSPDLCGAEELLMLRQPVELENVPWLLLFPGSAAPAAESESGSPSLWWRLPPLSAERLLTGRPSREMLLRNKRAACRRREFSLFFRLCSLVTSTFFPLAAAVMVGLCCDHDATGAAAAAAMVSVPLKKDLNCQIPFTRYVLRHALLHCHWSRVECVMT